ncbi:WecB/TagA/CpsF family glycosyltransferase [Lacisediminimonas profundi]|uniref:WecB/TagA/CpsF family glycosyltransferase n=1 Tax=Lacisediminimonas profundi TaxID=2603856 RepID=UPI00124BA487|nr:WecB/TagA/CpsF family glycosyltransferase [Lacisediminimonas profundi]
MQRERRLVLAAPIDALSWDDALNRIAGWSDGRQSRYVCICNVHSVVTTTRDSRYRRIIEEADMCTPDGAPVAWALRRLGCAGQERVNGPDLMWRYLALAEQRQQAVFFLGATDQTLERLAKAALKAFPQLRLVGMHAPPFRPLSEQEQEQEIALIRHSGAQVVFVGLGCPKQEEWMARHRGRIDAVMIGVGAAFDYHAGTVRRAPLWAQRNGLEWLFRLMSDPRRLFRRYMVTNTLFLLGIGWQLLVRRDGAVVRAGN